MKNERRIEETEAELARERAGFTVKQLAKRARISEAYLRRVERNGRAPFALAERLSILCRFKMQTYL